MGNSRQYNYGWPTRYKFEERADSIQRAHNNADNLTNMVNPKHGYLYRFDWNSKDHYLQLRAFPIVKKTPKGFHIAVDRYGGKKWIMGTGNRFGDCDLDKALASYKRRKEIYIQILKERLEEAEWALRGAAPPKDRDIALDFLAEEELV